MFELPTKKDNNRDKGPSHHHNHAAAPDIHHAGGLTENDFIIAAKINDMDKTDLAPPKRQRFWA